MLMPTFKIKIFYNQAKNKAKSRANRRAYNGKQYRKPHIIITESQHREEGRFMSERYNAGNIGRFYKDIKIVIHKHPFLERLPLGLARNNKLSKVAEVIGLFVKHIKI